MASGVENVLPFYSNESNVKRFGREPAVGLEVRFVELRALLLTPFAPLQAIKSELAQSHADSSFSVRIYNTSCQPSQAGSIVVSVAGELVQSSGEARAFIQTVLLASQGACKYYIFSDDIEWLSDFYTPHQDNAHAQQPTHTAAAATAATVAPNAAATAAFTSNDHQPATNNGAAPHSLPNNNGTGKFFELRSLLVHIRPLTVRPPRRPYKPRNNQRRPPQLPHQQSSPHNHHQQQQHQQQQQHVDGI